MIEALLEFQYGSSIAKELGLVFALQLCLYFVAASAVSAAYKLCSALGVGSRIEMRETYPNQIGHEILWSIGTCAITAIYLYFALAFVTDVHPSSLTIALVHVFGFIVFYDFYMYVTHRALHSSWLRKFHGRHHTAVSATPWSCLNMHPVEALINYLPFLLFAALTPVSLVVLLGVHIYLVVGIANGHSNYRVSELENMPFVLRELTSFHQKHHSDGRGNYGYLFTHWDWVFGTRHG